MRCGTSGYHYKFWGPFPGHPEVLNFYEDASTKQWLEFYSDNLKTVELNCTRYKKLTPKMCRDMVRKVPNDFTFTIKASTYITHGKKLNDFQEWWDEFYPCIEEFGERLECVLFQFHGSFKRSKKNIEKLKLAKKIIPKNIKCAFEFRDVDWFDTNPDLFGYKTLRRLMSKSWTQTILHVPEVRGRDTNFGNLSGGIHIGFTNSKFVYMRFHGTYDYSCGTYSTEELTFFIETAIGIADSDAKILSYFNNTDTWTLRPFTDMEGEYNSVPISKKITPSAVQNSLELYQISRLYNL